MLLCKFAWVDDARACLDLHSARVLVRYLLSSVSPVWSVPTANRSIAGAELRGVREGGKGDFHTFCNNNNNNNDFNTYSDKLLLRSLHFLRSAHHLQLLRSLDDDLLWSQVVVLDGGDLAECPIFDLDWWMWIALDFHFKLKVSLQSIDGRSFFPVNYIIVICGINRSTDPVQLNICNRQ